MQADPAPSTNLLALPDGTELVGDYRLKRVLGAGGFGITYLADEKALARLVTIKEYFPAELAARHRGSASPRSQEVAGDYQWGLDRFIEEAQTLARFDHPNIVRVHRYFRANNTAYMVLQFEEGSSFKAWLKGLRRAPRQAELDGMVAPLLDALEMIHKANYLHRDIAPDNIMVRKDGSPVLIDFGSARGAIAAQSRTVSALVKPGYSPYEQYATTSSNQGPWTDIYALGATLYHAISGKRPPDAPSRVVSDDYVCAREAALGAYRSGFLSAIDKALEIEVGERPQSILQWRGMLFAPEPKREPVRLGLRLPLARKLGQLRAATARAPVAPAPVSPAGAAVALDDSPQSLVPAPPDSPQPKGQLLDFIDALKKRRPRTRSPRKRPAKAPAAAPAPADRPAPAPAAGPEPAFGLGYGPPPAAPAPRRTASAVRSAARAIPRMLLPAARGRRAPPKPRRAWRPRLRLPSRRWRTVIFRVAAAVAIASFAVAYQERAQRTEPPRPGTASGAVAELAQVMQLVGHKGAVVAVAGGDFGRWIVSAGSDATLRVWNAGSGALVRTITLDAGPVTALAVGERKALTGHQGGTIVLWDLERAEKLASFQLGSSPVASIAFAGEMESFAASARDGSVAMFEIASPSTPKVLLEGHGAGARLVSASRSRGYLVAGGADRAVRLFRAPGPSLVRTYRNAAGDTSALQIADDGRYIAGGGEDGTVRVWTSWSSRTRRTFKAHDGRITALAFGPERLLATAGEDGTVAVWSLRSRRPVRRLVGRAGQVRALSFSPDGRRLLGAGQDGAIHVWSLAPSPAGGT
jgi:serine/threonine protein kinase